MYKGCQVSLQQLLLLLLLYTCRSVVLTFAESRTHQASAVGMCTGMRVLDSEYKLKQNIRIAMLYLEDDDAINAELFIKKASSLIAGNKVTLPE